MIINRTNLDMLQTGFKAAFQNALTGSGSTLTYNRITTPVTSTTKIESYAWLGQMPRIREWLGERYVKNIEGLAYQIQNRSWENTIEVDRDDIEDDLYGVYTPMMQQMGETARIFPEELTYATLALGFTQNCFDGQFFFDTDHPVRLADGTMGTYSNFGGGGGTPWYLIDASKPIKPLIFQTRRKFEFIAKDDPRTSDDVFNRKKFRYGTDGRMACGFAFPQLAFASRQTLDATNFKAGWTAMTGFKGDEGRPLNVKPNLLIVPSSLEWTARALIEKELVNAGESNELYKTIEVLPISFL